MRPTPRVASLKNILNTGLHTQSDDDAYCDLARQLERELAEAVEAIKEIAKGEGEFSNDALTHCTNAVVNMKGIARRFLEKVK